MRTRFGTSAFRVVLATAAVLFSVSAHAEPPLEPFEGNPGILVAWIDNQQFAVQDVIQPPFADQTHPAFLFFATLLEGKLHLNVATEIDGMRSKHLHAAVLFEKMMKHFQDHGQVIDAILGKWTYGSNLKTFNELVRQGKTPEQAASLTWTGRQAAKYGYVNAYIRSERYDRETKVYEEARVSFTKTVTDAMTPMSPECRAMFKPLPPPPQKR